MRIATALLLFGVAMLGSMPPVAFAHARPTQASPAPDSMSPPPTEIRIWFTQELTLRGNDIVVTDMSGARFDNADAHVDQSDSDRKQLVASLQPLSEGTYTVTWTSSSADDGHPATEAYTFTVVGEAPVEVVGGCPRHPTDQS
jgi:methionine-rich copper-binding protein CopC